MRQCLSRGLIPLSIGQGCANNSARATKTRFVVLPDEPVWLTPEDIVAIHDGQLARFGGLAGIKSYALVESAAASPLNHLVYANKTDVLSLAIILANAIVRDHPFMDGNKRTATIAMLEFLYLSGLTIDLPDSSAQQPLAVAMEELAAGTIDVAELERWLRPFLRAV